MNNSADMPAVYFYRKAECDLCEQLADELRAYRRAADAPAFRLIERDVDADADWAARYGELVPALVVNDATACEYFFDAARFGMALKQHAKQILTGT